METNTPWYDSNPLELLEKGEWNSDKDIIIGHTDGENDNFDYAQVGKKDLLVSVHTIQFNCIFIFVRKWQTII